jgi:transposase
MLVVYERCAGMDVHKRTVVVTILLTPPQDAPEKVVEKQTRTFGTMTADLVALSEWLEALGVTHVARESTGGYWWPVDTLLEEGRTILLVNPRHIKAVPGRQTEVKACLVARRPLAPWLAAAPFHPAPADPGAARADALAQDAGARAHRADQSAPEGLGSGQHEARGSGH